MLQTQLEIEKCCSVHQKLIKGSYRQFVKGTRTNLYKVLGFTGSGEIVAYLKVKYVEQHMFVL